MGFPKMHPRPATCAACHADCQKGAHQVGAATYVVPGGAHHPTGVPPRPANEHWPWCGLEVIVLVLQPPKARPAPEEMLGIALSTETDLLGQSRGKRSKGPAAAQALRRFLDVQPPQHVSGETTLPRRLEESAPGQQNAGRGGSLMGDCGLPNNSQLRATSSQCQ